MGVALGVGVSVGRGSSVGMEVGGRVAVGKEVAVATMIGEGMGVAGGNVGTADEVGDVLSSMDSAAEVLFTTIDET
jgi:hypothetical protein